MKPVPETCARVLCILIAGAFVGVGATYGVWDRGDAPVKRTVFVPRVISGLHVHDALASGDIVVLDSRTRVDFEAGHVPGALALFEAPGKPLLAEARRCIPQGAEVVLVGRRERDLNALRLAQRVREWGFSNVRVMKGGMKAWVADGYAVDKGWDMEPVLRMLGRDS